MRFFLIITMAVLSVGCQNSSMIDNSQSTFKPVNVIAEGKFTAGKSYTFLPRYEIEGDSLLMLCKNPNPNECQLGLSVSDYQSKRFELVSGTPIPSRETPTWGFYELLLESGEKLFAYNPKDLDFLYLDMYSIPSEDWKKIHGSKKETLVKGSDVSLIRLLKDFGNKYMLSNGYTAMSNDIKEIRKIYQSRPNLNPSIAGLMARYNVSLDEVDKKRKIEIYFHDIDDIANLSGDYVSAFVVIPEKGKARLFLKIFWNGSNWIFADGIKIASGEFSLIDQDVSFKRTNTSSSVYEWAALDASNGKYYEAIKVISEGESSTVRVYGSQRYADIKVSKEQREAIQNMLSIYHAFGL